MRLIVALCAALMLSGCSGNADTIRVKGSDTEVNLSVQLAESFHLVYPNIFVSISGGGSGLGIASLLNQTADVANSSRPINSSETDLFCTKKLAIDSFVFAQDAIAFVVSDKLGIDSISTTNLEGLLSGTIKSWTKIAGKNLPVNIYGRQSNSGTHDFIKKKLGIEFSPYAKEMNGNAQILEAIRADNSGIGYVGAGYILHAGKGLKVLTVSAPGKSAVSPLNTAMIAAGNYFFQRPLYQYYPQSSFAKIKPLLDFEKSETGKAIIKNAGYYPVMQ